MSEPVLAGLVWSGPTNIDVLAHEASDGHMDIEVIRYKIPPDDFMAPHYGTPQSVSTTTP